MGKLSDHRCVPGAVWLWRQIISVLYGLALMAKKEIEGREPKTQETHQDECVWIVAWIPKRSSWCAGMRRCAQACARVFWHMSMGVHPGMLAGLNTTPPGLANSGNYDIYGVYVRSWPTLHIAYTLQTSTHACCTTTSTF
eukprot:1150346-Pelagomonas_calceolata.AAC.7